MGGSFNAQGLNITVNAYAPLCETTNINVASFGRGEGAPSAVSYVGGNAGANVVPSYTATTLS